MVQYSDNNYAISSNVKAYARMIDLKLKQLDENSKLKSNELCKLLCSDDNCDTPSQDSEFYTNILTQCICYMEFCLSRLGLEDVLIVEKEDGCVKSIKYSIPKFSIFKLSRPNIVRIIDTRLKYGDAVETQEFYDILEDVYGLVEQTYAYNKFDKSLDNNRNYTWCCTQVYGGCFKKAIQRIQELLIGMGKENILKREPSLSNLKKQVYRYTINDFSLFNKNLVVELDPKKKLKLVLDSMRKSCEKKIARQGDTMQGLRKPTSVSEINDYYNEQIARIKQIQILELEYNMYERFVYVINNMETTDNNWLENCYNCLKEIKEEASCLITPIKRSYLLVFFADFVARYGLESKAVELYNESLTFLESEDLPHNLDYYIFLANQKNGLANLYIKQGYYNKAKDILYETIEELSSNGIYESNDNYVISQVLQIHKSLALVHNKLGELHCEEEQYALMLLHTKYMLEKS